MSFEYIAVPAPTKPPRNRAAKTAVERLAFAMTDAINEMADEGWEYLRTETMTVIDKAGRFSKTVERIETVLVFRRSAALAARPAQTAPEFVERETSKGTPLFKSKPAAEPARAAEPTPAGSTPDPTKANSKPAHEANAAPSLGGASRD